MTMSYVFVVGSGVGGVVGVGLGVDDGVGAGVVEVSSKTVDLCVASAAPALEPKNRTKNSTKKC